MNERDRNADNENSGNGGSPPLPPGVVRSTEGKKQAPGREPPPPGSPHPPPLSRGGRGVPGSGAESAPRQADIDTVAGTPLPSAGEGRGVRALPTGRITAIEPQQRREGRVSVFLNGEFAIGLSEEVAASLGLRVGQAVSAERLAEMERAETRARAREDAYRLLSYRDRSEKEVRDRLARREYAEEVIEETLAHLRENGYLDDARFAERWVAARGGTRGRRALAFELRQKGVGDAPVREALAEAASDDAQRAAAREAALRRVGPRPADTSPQAKTRLAAFLQRRGFDWDTIRPVLNELFGPGAGEIEED